MTISKEQFYRKVAENKFQKRIEEMYGSLEKDILASRREMFPFGSNAALRHFRYLTATRKLHEEINEAKAIAVGATMNHTLKVERDLRNDILECAEEIADLSNWSKVDLQAMRWAIWTAVNIELTPTLTPTLTPALTLPGLTGMLEAMAIAAALFIRSNIAPSKLDFCVYCRQGYAWSGGKRISYDITMSQAISFYNTYHS